MKYPATLTPATDIEGVFIVSFRDIPEALTQGDGQEEALFMAQDALITSMEFYFEDKRPVPLPSRPKKGEHLIELPVSIAAKVLLLNEMLASGIKNSTLAKALGVSQPEINRLINLKHSTKIDRIADALKVMGKNLEVRVS